MAGGQVPSSGRLGQYYFGLRKGVLVSDRPEAGAYRVTSGGAGAAAEIPLPVRFPGA